MTIENTEVALVEPKLPRNLNGMLGSYSQITDCPSWSNLHILGSTNLSQIIAKFRSQEKSNSSRISSLYEDIAFFEGRSGADFVEMAKDYENPTITKKGVPKNSWSGDDEPLGPNQARESGTTRFNICGWCPHASGTHRYSYCISGSCHFMNHMPKPKRKKTNEILSIDHYKREDERDPSRVKFDTPCRLHNLTAKDCALAVKKIKADIEEEKKEREQVRATIKRLKKSKKKAKPKPYLIALRPYAGFNVMDDVITYLGEWDGAIISDDWATGKVIAGYRHHDGCVSVCMDTKVHDGEYLDGHGTGAGTGHPSVLLRSEFDYLRAATDTKFNAIWFRNLNRSRNDEFDCEKYAAAVLNGLIAVPDEKPASRVPAINSVKDAQSLLNMLSEPKTKKDIQSSFRWMAKTYHPDRFQSESNTDEEREYATEMNAALIKAKEILIAKVEGK